MDGKFIYKRHTTPMMIIKMTGGIQYYPLRAQTTPLHLRQKIIMMSLYVTLISLVDKSFICHAGLEKGLRLGRKGRGHIWDAL